MLLDQARKELFCTSVRSVFHVQLTGCIYDTAGCWMFVYTIQPAVKPVWQPVVSCIQTFNLLSNRFDNRLHHVNGAWGMYFSYYAGLLLMSQSSIIINAPLGCWICLQCLTLLVGWQEGHPASKNKSSAVAEMGNRLATIGMGRKWGGAAVGCWVPTGSPSNTMWPGLRPTTLPSGILIHWTVWLQL